ncbi:hypothetical protein MRX96_041402 [Rhipicephalus microplus]|uniref:E3 ubiquitin-protein ligase n=1 Tax=Rhipicephalus microplus TaxID=6941 RepID=A0A9J6CYK6_RHIMP|nr:hypothetical protein HPB51_028160 [Rhipicephalus microplus]
MRSLLNWFAYQKSPLVPTMERDHLSDMCRHCCRPTVFCPVYRASDEAPERTASVTNAFATMATQTTTTTASASLSRLLECPVCGDYALPPILQCQNGHHLCTRCQQSVSRCPICNAPKGINRNLALDQMAEISMFPCKYHSLGCSATLALAAKHTHEMTCPHGPCFCVLGADNCSWRGRPEKLVDHILSKHSFIPRMQGENVVVTATGFDKVQNFTWLVLQTCHGRDFLVTLKRFSENSSFKQFFTVVALVGSSKDASRFQYRLNLCGSDQRLTFEGSMRDIRSLVECVQNRNGLIFSTSTAERLFGGGDLKMDITITSTMQSGDEV